MKKKGQSSTPDQSEDKSSAKPRPSTSSDYGDQFTSPAHKKLKDEGDVSQQKSKRIKGEPHKLKQHQKGPQKPQSAPPRGPPPQQGAWSKGPPQQQGEPPRGTPQQQGEPPRGTPQQQGEPPRGPPPQQGAWSKGPPQQQGKPPRGTPQQQGEPPRGPPPQQGAWSKGPPQQQGPRTRGPPPQQQGEPPRGPPPQQGAWSSGPPQQQGEPPRGPPPQQGEPPRGPPPQQGAWSKGPPQQQGPRTRGPPPQQQGEPPRGPPPQQRAPTRGPPRGDGESLSFAERIFAAKKSGRNIEVFSNFFPLIISDPNIEIFHYDVVIEPDKPKYLLRSVWNKFVSLMFPGRLTAFDGRNAYSKGPLTKDGSCSASVTVFNSENNKDKEFNVEIVEVRRISLSCFRNYKDVMRRVSSMKVLPEAEMSVLEIIMNNWACDNYVKSNRSFFHKSSTQNLSIKLSEKLSMRLGYFQSLFLGYKPYLNFDLSHKAFFAEVPVLKIVDCFRRRNSTALETEEMSHFLRSVKVEYTPPGDPSSRRVYRVNKLVGDAIHQTFTKDGVNLTVAKYFEKEKKCKLRYPELPLLWVGPNQKSIYVPMEFCTIAPNQIYTGLMDPFETRKMVESATSNARDRRRDLESLFIQTDINSHPLMREFGLQVLNQLERVPARVLNPPRLKTSRSIRVDGGVWRIQDFLEPVTLNKWCVLNLDKRVNQQSVDNLQRMIKSKGTEFNMRIADPARAPMEGEPSFAALKRAFSQLKGMDLVFVIISEVKGVYSRVKAICETQEGILTQCIKSRTVSQDPRKFTTTVQNILLKVNTKLGGKNHSLDQSSTPQCLKGYVMVVGADVTHPSPGMNIPSVAAITVSCDPAAFQYGTTTRVQQKNEMILDLEEVMAIHLRKFYEIRKSYPEKIIFFRDGVSEGELPKVFKGELAALKRACNNLCQPKITFVIVQKRHHTRFFPTSSEDEEGRHFNVPVGTCVDSDIVHPRDLDFYLLSHASLLGTARPTRYRLLYDDNKLTDDELETLSYYLCHLFARCNRSVSYPSPTFNAHLAAARVRTYLEGLNLTCDKDVAFIQKEMEDKISSISPMFFV